MKSARRGKATMAGADRDHGLNSRLSRLAPLHPHRARVLIYIARGHVLTKDNSILINEMICHF